MPVIIISGYGTDSHVVRAFEMGALDHIAKPFSPTELVARIRATLRRQRRPDRADDLAPYVLGDLTIDYGARSVTVGGEPVRLTATEFKLLAELSTNAGRVLTQGQLLSRIWGLALSGNSQSGPQLVRAFVRNLRRRLGDDATIPGTSSPNPALDTACRKPKQGKRWNYEEVGTGYSPARMTTRPPSRTWMLRSCLSSRDMPTRGLVPTAPLSTYLGRPFHSTVAS